MTLRVLWLSKCNTFPSRYNRTCTSRNRCDRRCRLQLAVGDMSKKSMIPPSTAWRSGQRLLFALIRRGDFRPELRTRVKAMSWKRSVAERAVIIAATIFCCSSCATPKRPQVNSLRPMPQEPVRQESTATTACESSSVLLTAHRQAAETSEQLPTLEVDPLETHALAQPQSQESLVDLEAWAIMNNPTLRRMQQEAAAEWAKTGYVSKLPDPTVSSMFFTPPMNFEPDRQLAELQVMQMIPWLGRLQAEARRAHMEALVAETQYQAERLRVLGDIRATWFKLYVLGSRLKRLKPIRRNLNRSSQLPMHASGPAMPSLGTCSWQHWN